MKKLIFLIAFLFTLVGFINPSLSLASNQVDQGTGRMIIKFKSLTPKFYRESLFQSYGFGSLEKLSLPDTYVVKVPKGQLTSLFNRLQQNLALDYVEEDFIVTIQETPNDEFYAKQWGLEKIKSPGAWDKTHGNGGVKIAIIDTGINGAHPDLGSKVISAVDCTVSSACPVASAQDNNGHGTHVAGIASAVTNNGIGTAGVSWEGQLMSVKALDNSGSGYTSWAVDAIYWAANNGARVINLSMGSGNFSTTLQNAVDYAWGKGVVVVAAAGNNGSNRKYYPAYFSNAIAVAATNKNDVKTSFSNYGTWVDVAAPGDLIYSTYKAGYGLMSGTSMAAPFVSGLAALVIGQNPTWSNTQVRNKIESSADKISGTGSYFTYGRINACKAVGCDVVVTPTPMVTPTPTVVPTSVPTPTPILTPTTTPIVITTPTPTVTPTVVPTPTPTVTPMVTPTPTVKPSPTPTPLPWWCKISPSLCK